MARENTFELDTACEIGSAVREQYNPPTLEAGSHYLASFTRWADCVAVLGRDAAMQAANEGFMGAEIKAQEGGE